MGDPDERKAPSKVNDDLNINEEGDSAFLKNPETGETEIYRRWGEEGSKEWHGPYGPGAPDSDDE